MIRFFRMGRMQMNEPERPDGVLAAFGNYRASRSFQKAEIVYDLTCRFVGAS